MDLLEGLRLLQEKGKEFTEMIVVDDDDDDGDDYVRILFWRGGMA